MYRNVFLKTLFGIFLYRLGGRMFNAHDSWAGGWHF